MHCQKPIIITRGAKWRNLASNNKNYDVLFLCFVFSGETRWMNNKHASMSNFSGCWGAHVSAMSKRRSHLTKWLKQTRRNWWNSNSKMCLETIVARDLEAAIWKNSSSATINIQRNRLWWFLRFRIRSRKRFTFECVSNFLWRTSKTFARTISMISQRKKSSRWAPEVVDAQLSLSPILLCR